MRRDRDRGRRIELQLDPAHRRTLEDYAAGQHLSLSEAARRLFDLVLAATADPDGDSTSRLEPALARVEQMIDTLGPAAVGLPRLLAYWATRSGSLTVSEDELIEEFWWEAERLWDAEVERLDDALAEAPTRGEEP